MEKKCLYIDIVSPNEHLNYNKGFLRNIPEEISVDICAKGNYIAKEEVNYNNYFCIPDEFIYTYSEDRVLPQLYMRMKIVKAIKWIKHSINLEQYDIVVWAYIDEIIFSLMCKNKKSRVIFMDHLIGEISNSKIKRFFFKRIRKEFEFIAFEDYIKNFVKEIDPSRKIWVVRHPLPVIPEFMKRTSEDVNGDTKLIFAPALSNDEKFIDYIIENKDILPKNIKIVIRSTQKEYSSSNVIVYRKRISNEMYYTYMKDSAVVLIHYGEGYNFRTSGVLYEAVRLRKPVVLFCGNTLENYYTSYPNIIYPFYTNDEFLKNIEKWVISAECTKSDCFDKILSDYSDREIRDSLLEVFNF